MALIRIEIFFGRGNAKLSQGYLVAGVGSTDVAGLKRQTVTAGFGLRVGSSAVDGFVLQARGNGGSNSLFGYAEVIGPAGTVGTASPLRATLASGQFWQRVVLFNGYVRFFYGTGSAGAEPTSWTELGSSSSLGGVTPTNTAYLECTLGLGGSGSPDAVTVEWDNVSASIVGLR